ncbi:LTV-domain-containing protein [Infundibulicybe gibba]|nr:LTV-domain-containing protein [Infundibulicybe gibba]
MPPKSIFRQPGAKHFQLVHRSQRDPLIHDPDANQQVLKPFERENSKKGKSLKDLESLLVSETTQDREGNVGEAASYGIYYDDTEYNYMQHLRPILIEAPSTSTSKNTSRGRKSNVFDLEELPDGVLASMSELPRTYESQQAIPESLSGFQPDMDPHLRQVLEALDDEAFVDDDLEDNFFTQLVRDGVKEPDEEFGFEFQEESVGACGQTSQELDDASLGWEQRFAQFKQTQNASANGAAGSDDGGSEGGDTIGGLPTISVIGGKRRKGRGDTSDASGYSMSSSSMYRTEALQTLDERFDQMILKEYNEDDDESPHSDTGDDDEAPDLITSREDFGTIMDEFLNDYEILGRKMKPKLSGENGAEKLDTLRRAMGQDDRILIEGEDEDLAYEMMLSLNEDEKKDRWDCETVLTTYSNLENHPRLIRAREPRAGLKISLDAKTGLPTIQQTPPIKTVPNSVSETDISKDSGAQQTLHRPRNESKDAKKARKDAVRIRKQARRVSKKEMKEKFGVELLAQKRTVVDREKRLQKL